MDLQDRESDDVAQRRAAAAEAWMLEAVTFDRFRSMAVLLLRWAYVLNEMMK